MQCFQNSVPSTKSLSNDVGVLYNNFGHVIFDLWARLAAYDNAHFVGNDQHTKRSTSHTLPEKNCKSLQTFVIVIFLHKL